VAGGSSQTFSPPIFVLSGNTWQLQVKTSAMTTGSYLATMIDLSLQVPDISVTFNLN